MSYFYENGIAFYSVASLSFALIIEERLESIKFTRQNPLQSYRVPHQFKFLGKLLDNAYESTKKLALILAVAYGENISSDEVYVGTTLVSQALSAGRVSPM